MRSKVRFGLTESNENSLKKYYDLCESIVCIQDTIHIGTKLRNRLLKPSVMLPMGNTLVSVAHIKLLLNSVSKEIHGLVLTDICPLDRQNYGSLEKVIRPRVLESMEKYIVNSDATIQYLRICEQITSCFLNNELKPIERVYKI